MNLPTIAEGVEPAEQAAAPAALGRRSAQVHHLAEPMPAEDLLDPRSPVVHES